MKRFFLLFVLLCLMLCTVGCGEEAATTAATTTTGTGTENAGAVIPFQSELVSGQFTKFDQKTDVAADAPYIVFSGSAVSCSAPGVTVDGTTAVITAGGEYVVCGICPDGQLIIEVPKTEKVHLVFDGLSLACDLSAPLYVKSADKVTVTLKDGTVSTFADTATPLTALDAPTACIYAKDDLTFNGSGALRVEAQRNNGIGCSNDLCFISGTYEVTAPKNALKGNDSLAILDGTFTLNAGKDACKADTIDDPAKGFIYIAGGTFRMTAGDDGLQASTAIELQGGRFRFACTGKKVNAKLQYHRADSVIFETAAP